MPCDSYGLRKDNPHKSTLKYNNRVQKLLLPLGAHLVKHLETCTKIMFY